VLTATRVALLAQGMVNTGAWQDWEMIMPRSGPNDS